MIKFFGRRREKRSERIELERIVYNFLDRADELVSSGPKLGKRFLKQAHKHYEKVGYEKKIESKINKVYFKYLTLLFPHRCL